MTRCIASPVALLSMVLMPCRPSSIDTLECISVSTQTGRNVSISYFQNVERSMFINAWDIDLWTNGLSLGKVAL